ncbi:MAG: hypothetical protein WB951_17750 [Candidatus Sulfotelmatobacter sp.]|jgi:hypothetical protein
MRVPTFVFLLFVTLASPASARQHEVQLQVLLTFPQIVRGVGVGPGITGDLSIPIACAQPYPGDTVGVVPGNPGSADHCLLASPSGDFTGSVQARRVKAILTTDDGQRYFVDLDCQKQYGWCASLADHATYVGKLSEQPKSLSNYQNPNRRGFMKISLRPNGKKKVTYTIYSATRLGPANPQVDPNRHQVSFPSR